jgi:glyoxylase-like metal-dependent hydrolase (beta-lactamase superfamily II)
VQSASDVTAPSLAYLEVPTPPPGEVIRVADAIHWIRFPLPMELDHINLWLIEHDRGFVLIDTGMRSAAGHAVWEKLERQMLARRPLRLIVMTHLHADHTGFAAWLQHRHRVPVWTSRDTERQMRQLFTPLSDAQVDGRAAYLRAHGMADSDPLRASLSGERYRANVTGLPRIAHHPADGEDTIWEGAAWRWIATNGHAAGHLCLHEPSRRVLITGDQILPGISPNVSLTGWGLDANPIGSYLDSLERLGALHPQTLVLPSHGRPFVGVRARALELRAHHRRHLDQLLETCREARSASETLGVLYRRPLAGFHLFLALGEAIAHLEYLVRGGLLVRFTDDRGAIRYVRPQ